ncbi:hypothetical protein XF36_13320 [Pseudonocardia sp. HH130629-09]|nr:hypothetical protein XF36_13320 [Pseudonocardia sp. HH130629-09]
MTDPVTGPHQGLVSSSAAGRADGTDPAVHGTDDTAPAPGRPTGAPAPGAHGPSPASAPPPADQVLLDLALTGTASHVESVVRAAGRRLAPPATTAALPGVSWYHDSDGSLVLRARLTPDDGAALVAAIESHVVAVAPSTAAPSTEPDPRVGPHERAREAAEHAPGAVVDTLAARRADALLDLVTCAGDGDGGPVVSRPGTRVTVVVDAATGSARLDGGPEIPAPTAERLACDARARVLLTDRHANHLYLGRSRRLAGPSQIAALSAAGAAEGRPGAGSPAAHTPGTCMPTTSGTGCTAAPPTSTTWCCCAASATGSCTTTATPSSARPGPRQASLVSCAGLLRGSPARLGPPRAPARSCHRHPSRSATRPHGRTTCDRTAAPTFRHPTERSPAIRPAVHGLAAHRVGRRDCLRRRAATVCGH